MATDDEERQAQERAAAEQRSFKKLTWPVWGPTGHEHLYMRLDEGVEVLYECLRCGAVVAALGLHEQMMHPDDPLRESSRWDMEEFVMPSPGHREIREMPMKRDDVLTSTVSFDCRTVDGEGVANVITRVREVFKRAGWTTGVCGGSRREGPIWTIQIHFEAPGHEIFDDSPVIVEALNAAAQVGPTYSLQISIEIP